MRVHYQPKDHRQFPLLAQNEDECYSRTPEEQLTAKQQMDLELLRSFPPEAWNYIEAMIAQGMWENSKPCKDSNPFD